MPRKKKTIRKCIVCSLAGSYQNLVPHCLTKEHICKDCARRWRRRELFLYKATSRSINKLSLANFEGSTTFLVERFENCAFRYKYPHLVISEKHKHNPHIVANHININTNKAMFTSTGTENDEEDDEEDEGDYEEEEEEEEDILENMNPKIRQSLQNLANTGLENCAVTEKPEAVDDFFSLDITGIIGNKLLESVEHMTYSIRKVVSGAQYGQNSLAQQIQKKCQTVLRRQQAIKNELAELKITLQQFKCGSSIRHS